MPGTKGEVVKLTLPNAPPMLPPMYATGPSNEEEAPAVYSRLELFLGQIQRPMPDLQPDKLLLRQAASMDFFAPRYSPSALVRDSARCTAAQIIS